MKKNIIKRIVYHSPNSGTVLIGAEEYDNHLTNDNILGAIHEIGKTKWIGSELWAIRGNELIYRITVEQFTQYQKSWYDLVREWFDKN